jgi:hypothetical protein
MLQFLPITTNRNQFYKIKAVAGFGVCDMARKVRSVCAAILAG